MIIISWDQAQCLLVLTFEEKLWISWSHGEGLSPPEVDLSATSTRTRIQDKSEIPPCESVGEVF